MSLFRLPNTTRLTRRARAALGRAAPFALVAAGLAVAPSLVGAAVIGKESRQRFDDYARRSGVPLAAVQARFGASGLLDCPGRLSSAQVVADRRVILTNAHNLLNGRGKPAWALNACVLQLPGPDGKPIELRVSARNFRFGTLWPDGNRIQDWAVLSLERPVPPTVRPYRIVNPLRRPIPRRGPITVVAGSHDNWRGRGRRESSIETCRLRPIRVQINGRHDLLGFDCDTGKGASGAALLQRDATGVRLIGLGVGQRDRGAGAPYDGASHFNAAVPIHGRIYQAIQSVRRALRQRGPVQELQSRQPGRIDQRPTPSFERGR